MGSILRTSLLCATDESDVGVSSRSLVPVIGELGGNIGETAHGSRQAAAMQLENRSGHDAVPHCGSGVLTACCNFWDL